MHSVRQFELIRALARHRHFGRAAAELGVSQPALTRSLQHIEDDLGVRLFDREGAVSPTLFGEILLSRGEQVISSFVEAMREIALLKGLDFGELTIAAGPYPTAISIQRAIGELVTRHPRLLIQLRVKNWPDVMADVISGAADVGVADVAEAASRPELETEILRRSRLSFFCRAGHPILRRSPVVLRDLTDYPWVGPSLPARMRAVVPDENKPFGVHDVRNDRFQPRVLVETFSAAKEIVKAGDGLSAALPAQLAGEIADGTLALVPVSLPWLDINYGFITRRGRSLSPAAVAFRDVLKAVEAAIDGSYHEGNP